MSVDRTALWILMGLCCATAVPVVLRVKLSSARPERRRDRLGVYADAIMIGVAVGEGAAFATLLVASLVARA